MAVTDLGAKILKDEFLLSCFLVNDFPQTRLLIFVWCWDLEVRATARPIWQSYASLSRDSCNGERDSLRVTLVSMSQTTKDGAASQLGCSALAILVGICVLRKERCCLTPTCSVICPLITFAHR